MEATIYHYTPTRMTAIEKHNNSKFWTEGRAIATDTLLVGMK